MATIERQLEVLTPEEQTIEIIKESGATELAQRAIEKSSTIESATEIAVVTDQLSKEIKELPYLFRRFAIIGACMLTATNVKEEIKAALTDHFKSL